MTKDARSERVDALFASWDWQSGTPGAAVRVIQDDEVVHSGHYGLADIDRKVRIGPDTAFLLASVTKPFTALAIQILVESGDLWYDQRLSEFFPEFPDYARRITVHQLLLHTSGLREFEDTFKEAGVIRKDDWYPRPESTDPSPVEPTSKMTLEFLSRQMQLNFEPGTQYDYCNSGYVVLAQIIERVTGRPFPEFVKAKIFDPARMPDSVIPVGHWRDVPNRAKSYAFEDGKFQNRDYTPLNLVYGEDGIYTTADDMANWDRALNSNKLVSQRALAGAYKPGSLADGSRTPTGLGWFVGDDLVDHSGQWQGFQTYIRRYRSLRLTVIVLANCSQLDAATCGEGISRIYLDSRSNALSGTRSSRTRIEPPPAGKLYHGVYPGKHNGNGDDITAGDLKAYEGAVRKKVALVYFSNEWATDAGRQFPLDKSAWIHDHKAVPFVRLMLRSSTDSATKYTETVYTLDRILAGLYDDPLRAWGEKARQFGRTLLVEYGTECNGGWMPWNAVHNAPNGPRKFQAVFRRIVRLMSAATNIRWVFHVNGDDSPKTHCNCLEAYYPGDDVVDWLAVSCYGAQKPEEVPEAFAPQMDQVYGRLRALAPSKPVFVAEFGCCLNDSKVTAAAWADAALGELLSRSGGKWDKLIGFSWWNSYWDNDPPAKPTNMLVQEVEGLTDVFRRRLDSPVVQVDPVVR
jgi:CubicO group peptidase (beta-lactamase class C family)